MLKFVRRLPASGSNSLNTTPEPTPRMPRTNNRQLQLKTYDSELSLVRQPYYHGSTASLASTSSSTQNAYTRRHKGRAPLPPGAVATEIQQATTAALPSCSPSASTRPSPISTRKKRPAPPPPKQVFPASVCSTPRPASYSETLYMTACDVSQLESSTDFSNISNIDKTFIPDHKTQSDDEDDGESKTPIRKLIPLDDSLLNDGGGAMNEPNYSCVVYRRTIMPISDAFDSTTTTTTDDLSSFTTTGDSSDPATSPQHARQWQKVKENKESQNKNRQSQVSLVAAATAAMSPGSPDSDPSFGCSSNKSTFGKWKRRKGPAPALPIPPRKMLQMVPLQEIRYELEVIEVQQQGLEKQVN